MCTAKRMDKRNKTRELCEVFRHCYKNISIDLDAPENKYDYLLWNTKDDIFEECWLPNSFGDDWPVLLYVYIVDI